MFLLILIACISCILAYRTFTSAYALISTIIISAILSICVNVLFAKGHCDMFLYAYDVIASHVFREKVIAMMKLGGDIVDEFMKDTGSPCNMSFFGKCVY